GTRYRLLETVREYATERLAEEGRAAAAAIRRRHATYFAELAARSAATLWGPGQVAGLGHLDAELDNLRAALAWGAADDGDPAVGLRLGGALWRFWGRRGRAGEGRAYLEQLLARGAGAQDVRAGALFAAAYLAWRQGDLAQARARG